MSDQQVIDYLLAMVNKRRKKGLTKETIVGYICDPTTDPVMKRKEKEGSGEDKPKGIKLPTKSVVCDHLLGKFGLELKRVQEEILQK